jgi:transketolase
LTKEAYGWPVDRPFYVPDEVLEHMRASVVQGQQWEAEWNRLWQRYQTQYPELAQELQRALAGQVPPGALDDLKSWAEGDALATRQASGEILNQIAAKWPTLIGGSADLAPSNNTTIKGAQGFSAETPEGRNFHFGVREHAMGSALNGMILHGGLRVYGGTFLIFSDYMRPAIRLAALMHQPVIYVFTHDSIGLGEDGPTHQPIEQLAALRAIPGLWVVRPADANETREAWKLALSETGHPVALALTRQKVPSLPSAVTVGLHRGGYVVEKNRPHPELVLMATGSEVGLIREAYRQLDAQGVPTQVVSLPCWELFDQQDAAYRASVLPPNTVRLAVEAASPFGWERYAQDREHVIGIDHFGASAPGERVFKEFGFTADHVVELAHQLLR